MAGIWKQRIEGTWVKCSTPATKLNIVNLNGAPGIGSISAMSLKHKSIDQVSTTTGTASGTAAFSPQSGWSAISANDWLNMSNYGSSFLQSATPKYGFIYNDIGGIGDGFYSYILDYYYGPSINSTINFKSGKVYQFKTHVLNFANVFNPGAYQNVVGPAFVANPAYTIKQKNGNVYYSSMNIFKGALGISPSWEDLYYFDVPYYIGDSAATANAIGSYNRANPSTPSMYILYYYSSPKSDTESGFVAFHNKLRPSAVPDASNNDLNYKIGTQSTYQAGYGITGVEVNETAWKMQGYSFASYDNKPDLGITTLSFTNSLSYPTRKPIKQCVFGKGWYYDDENKEYTWYDRFYNDEKLDLNNNPVGGDIGLQANHEGYRENNFIAKYIPFQKFNLSFLYENARTDCGIKIYLSPTLPTSKPIESSKYTGKLKYPSYYFKEGTQEFQKMLQFGAKFTLVTSNAQLNYPLPITLLAGSNSVPVNISQSGGIIAGNAAAATFSFPSLNPALTQFGNRKGDNYYALVRDLNIPYYMQQSFASTQPSIPTWKRVVQAGATTSSIISDYPAQPLVNTIYVDDDNTNLKEIRVNITLRHTYIADMIINLKVPNGNVINIKAKYSGDFFNDLRNITFTTSTKELKMSDYTTWRNVKADWWPNDWGFKDGKGDIEDPIGIVIAGSPVGATATPTSQTVLGAVTAPWLPAPYGQGSVKYNFSWAQLKIRNGLTFQMDKSNGQGTAVGGTSYRSNVNDLKYLSNEDNTFLGTYSLYIKDDWGGDSGLLESWSIEFFYKKEFTPILTLTQSDPENAINKGAAKLQYLFGLEGNQYLFIKGDKAINVSDPVLFQPSGVAPQILTQLKASLKSLKIDGGYHDANNRQYLVNDRVYGQNSSPTSNPAGTSDPASSNISGIPGETVPNTSTITGSGGDNSFALMSPISNVAYSTYVGSGNLNEPNKLSLSAVSAKIGNGAFRSGIWENGAWNSGWRTDDTMKEFYVVDNFFSYDRDRRWRFSIYGSADSASYFSVGEKVSIGNITAIDVNEERKLLKSYFTIIGKTIDSIAVEFESDFPIRRIKIDSTNHRIYVSKNVWLNGGFFNGYFSGIWNAGIFKGFPYITEMADSHWIDGAFRGGHFKAAKKSVAFSNTYLASLDRIKVGLIFDKPHRLAYGDQVVISSTSSSFGATKIAKVVDDYKVITDINWDDSKDPNLVGWKISGIVSTSVSTGLIQNIDIDTQNVSSVTSLQSMESARVFIYNSWIDVNFDSESAVNIGKPQSTIDTNISRFGYSDNNLFGYPTYDVLSSDVSFRDSFSNTIRKYKLGSKYKIFEDYIGDAGEFDEYFDKTGWATKRGMYRKTSFPFLEFKNVGDALASSPEFTSQGWVLNKDTATGSAINAERTGEAEDDEDVAAGKEIRISSVGRGGFLNIQRADEVPNRNNGEIPKLRYTMAKFDLLSASVPDFLFEESNTSVFDSSSKYQPPIHFNNLNLVTRKIFVPGTGYVQKRLDATFLPIYKNVNHVTTSKLTKTEFFYNKRTLSMSFRGNGLDGENISTFVIDNLKLYEVDMIPFFQYFNKININKSVSVPYQAVAPMVAYPDLEFDSTDKALYGIDSFAISQPSGEITIQAESAAAAAEAAAEDPVVAAATTTTTPPYVEEEYGQGTGGAWFDPSGGPGGFFGGSGNAFTP